MIPEALTAHPRVAALGDLVLEAKQEHGELTLVIDPARILDALRVTRGQGFNRLSAVTAVDWHPAEPRFEVVYHLHLLPVSGAGRHERLRLKCRISGAEPEIDSATSVYPGANWYEREVFDLFGIEFRHHPDPTRIMMPDYWEGHPLRKDYPIDGYQYSYAKEH